MSPWQVCNAMVCGMDAAPTPEDRGTPATVTVRFDDARFDARTAELGAETEPAKAALCGVDRSTLFRYRKGQTVPSLPDAMQFARRINLTAADLWIEV
jgi:hypothetical protein